MSNWVEIDDDYYNIELVERISRIFKDEALNQCYFFIDFMVNNIPLSRNPHSSIISRELKRKHELEAIHKRLIEKLT